MAWAQSKVSRNSTQRSPRQEPPQAPGDGEQKSGGRVSPGQSQLRLPRRGVQAVPGLHPRDPQPQGAHGGRGGASDQGAGEDCCQFAPSFHYLAQSVLRPIRSSSLGMSPLHPRFTSNICTCVSAPTCILRNG